MATLLNSRQMASFVARGFLRFDGIVPAQLNADFLDAVEKSEIPQVAAGATLSDAYPENSVLGRIITLGQIAGAIRSLVGADPIFDHHFHLEIHVFGKGCNNLVFIDYLN